MNPDDVELTGTYDFDSGTATYGYTPLRQQIDSVYRRRLVEGDETRLRQWDAAGEWLPNEGRCAVNLGDLVRSAEEACPKEWGEFRVIVRVANGGGCLIVGAVFDEATGNVYLHANMPLVGMLEEERRALIAVLGGRVPS